jgi:pimeloyl-ACP methyl ester carboxylesterase
MQKNITLLLIVLAITSGNISWGKLLGLGAIMIGFFIWSLYRYQEKLLYQPRIYPQYATPGQNPAGYRSPSEHDMPYTDVYLHTSDRIKLHAWWIHSGNQEITKQRPTLLFFHANAGNMGFRLQNLKQLHSKLNINIFILSYRGYGESEGEPSEHGLNIDAETAWQHLHSRPDVDVNNIFIFGRSMGGAVAISLASRHMAKIRGVILENTFTCISDMADQLFPFLKPIKKWILRLDWNSISRIGTITSPILFLSGLLDEVVPSSHMVRLHATATASENRQFAAFPKGMHNDTWLEGGPEYPRVFGEFISRWSSSKTSNKIE